MTYNGVTYELTDTQAGQADPTPDNNLQNYNYPFPDVGEINDDQVEITGVKGHAANNSSNTTGYEQLSIQNMTFNKASINDGSYIDFNMGLPTQNELVPYDSSISPTQDIYYQQSKVGTLYRVNGFYRLVFNQEAASINQKSRLMINKLTMNWNNAGSRNASAIVDSNNLPLPLVYQYTEHQNQNGKTFIYTPVNDVLIGNKYFTSGLSVSGQYVYRGYHYNENQQTTVAPASTYRVWVTENKMLAAPNWSQSFQITPDTSKLGSSFSVTLTVPVLPTNFSYEVVSNDDIANAIKNNEAKSATLSNQLKDSNSKTYLNIEKTDHNVVPTVTSDNRQTITKDGVQYYVYTWHVSGLEDNGSPVSIAGGITFLNVNSDQKFTAPNGVNSYTEASARKVSQGSYYGTDTGNSNLLTTLENLPKAEYTVSGINGQKPISNSLNWYGAISQYQPNLNFSDNSGNASSQNDAQLYNPQGHAMWVWSGNWKLMSGLSSKDGIDIEKTNTRFQDGFEQPQNDTNSNETSIWDIIDAIGSFKVRWDLTGFVFGKQTANVTIIYPDGSIDTTKMTVLVLQEPSFIRYNQVRPDEKQPKISSERFDVVLNFFVTLKIELRSYIAPRTTSPY